MLVSLVVYSIELTLACLGGVGAWLAIGTLDHPRRGKHRCAR